jgi:peptidoglycan DL-endopeptidase CwlO
MRSRRRYHRNLRRFMRRYGKNRIVPARAVAATVIVLAAAGLAKAPAAAVGGHDGGAGGRSAHASHAVHEAIRYAKDQIGKPYIWGGPTWPGTSGGFDCSGLVMEAYSHAGISLPRTSQDQWARGVKVTDPQPGDLVFFAGADGTPSAPGHVGLVIGDHRMVQAYTTGTNVMISSFGRPSSLGGLQTPVGYTRPTAHN